MLIAAPALCEAAADPFAARTTVSVLVPLLVATMCMNSVSTLINCPAEKRGVKFQPSLPPTLVTVKLVALAGPVGGIHHQDLPP